MRCRNQRGGKRGVKARFQQKEENCGSQFKAKHPGKKKYNEHFEEKKKKANKPRNIYTPSPDLKEMNQLQKVLYTSVQSMYT